MKVKRKQFALLDALVAKFRQNEAVHVILLGGSLVDFSSQVDDWSDIDLVLVIEDGQEVQFIDVASWSKPFGSLVGVEVFHNTESITLRICLENYQRLDMVLISLSEFNKNGNKVPSNTSVLWKRDGIPVAKEEEAPEKESGSFALNPAEVLSKVNALWFQASVAVAKVVRNDDLIAYHLTLMVMQGVLELQMMRRDAALGTNVHRNAGWGNDLVNQFPQVKKESIWNGILQTLLSTCELLDQLAGEMLADYSPRLPLLQPEIQKALEDA